MTREEAINEIKSWAIPSKRGREVLETLIPELRENEDEKMMKNIRLALLSVDDVFWRTHGITEKEALAYLEKQKEQKPIEDIVKDITENKESAIKFLKSTGIMDDNGELAEIYRSEQKPADYDHEMWKNCEANFEGGKKEVIDHPEKYGLQKEQKPIDDGTREKIISRAKSEKQVVLISESSGKAEIGWDTRSLEDTKKLLEHGIAFVNKQLGTKPTDWSEEDERMLERAIHIIVEYSDINEKESEIVQDWLKSLRPKPHWKPSEEQMEALEIAERWYSDNMGCNLDLVSLCEQLKKLM